jgi:hypothetical protein
LERVLLSCLTSSLAGKSEFAVQSLPEEAATAAHRPFPTEDYGWVVHDGKPIRKPIGLLLMSTRISFLQTDSSGQFYIPVESLIQFQGKNMVVATQDKNQQGSDYHIVAKNDYDSLNDQLARGWYVPLYMHEDSSGWAEEQMQNESGADDAQTRIRTLKAVVVRPHGESDESIAGIAGITGCTDWVCLFNVLNCPNHPDGRPPKIGEVYHYIDPSTGRARPIKYEKCTSCDFCNGEPRNPSVVAAVRRL